MAKTMATTSSMIKTFPMAIPSFPGCHKLELLKEDAKTRDPKRQDQGGEEGLSYEFQEFLDSLPKENGWRTRYLYLFQGFWCQSKEIEAIMSFQKHFKSLQNDIVVATIPKSGTTWLKALTFTVLNRHRFDPVSSSTTDHPLLTSNPHDLVPFFEYKLYANGDVPDLSRLTSPRTFATHIPFSSLKDSIGESNTKVVYLCRNPFDTFISSWHYTNNIKSDSTSPVSLEDGFDKYCKGVIGFGPFWEHMLGYWRESLKSPEEVLFLQYEDLKQDTESNLKKLARFLDVPFTEEEEANGVVKAIVDLCSFENLKKLEVNKSSKSIKNFENKHLFRKGEVSDWVNYLSASQVERLSCIVDDKLGGSGLTFR